MLTRVSSRCYSSVAANAGRLNPTTTSLLSNRMNKQVEFNWKKYLDTKDHFYESMVPQIKRWDAQLAAARTAAADADKVVEPIDWKYWEGEIEDKQALRQVREEYENMKFPPQEGVDVSALELSMRTKLKHFDNIARMMQEDIVEFQEQLVIAKEDVEEVPNYTYWDWMRKFPGASEQLAQEFDEGYTAVQPSAWDFYMDKPNGKLRQALRDSTKPPMVPPTMPFVYGQFDVLEEYKYFLEWERKTLTPFGIYEEIKKKLDTTYDEIPAYIRAREAIDVEVANYSGYDVHGGH